MLTTTGIRLTTEREPTPTMRFHLIGIGGAGMSALARLLHAQGIAVSGSDLVETPTLHALRALGIHAYSPHDPEQMGAPDWVVVSDAIHPDNPEVVEAMRRNLPLWRRSQLMGWLLRHHRVIAVSGTHGKSTTTAMIATMLEHAGYDPLVLIGADTPYPEPWQGNIRLGQGEWAVVEACEAYESFLDLQPEIAVITNIDPDHLDYHGTLEQLLQSFERFLHRVKPGGTHILGGDSRGVQLLIKRIQQYTGQKRPTVTYGLGADNEVHGQITARSHLATDFVVYAPLFLGASTQASFHLPYPGDHNVQNALGAIAVALTLQIPIEVQQAALAQFHGVKRRQEIVGEAGGVAVIDDYAHHPVEIHATLNALRQRFPNRRLVVIYQPHMYSRTRDHLADFIESLARADFVVITDIYPAREKPIPGVSAALIADGLLARETPPTLYIPIKEQIPSRLLPHLKPNDVVVTMGAGDIDQIAPTILRLLEERGQVRRLRIAVLMGGDSPERDVSLLSGMRVLQALNPERYLGIPVDPALPRAREGIWSLRELLGEERPDLAFIALHGRHGEDGAIQGLLELLGIPYTGSGVLASALAMNKHAAKILFKEVGLATPPAVLAYDDSWETCERIQQALQLPAIVKPNQGGSTLGTSRVFAWDALPNALRKALAFDNAALVEAFIEGTEVSVPVLGTRNPLALPPVEIAPKSGYYDFEAKYIPGMTDEIVPARLPEEVLELLKATAVIAHRALGCRGLSRVDMIVRDHIPYVLEVNTVPGLTPTSLLPRSAEAAGIGFAELIERIIRDALEGL